jgi:hypothetical protein
MDEVRKPINSVNNYEDDCVVLVTERRLFDFLLNSYLLGRNTRENSSDGKATSNSPEDHRSIPSRSGDPFAVSTRSFTPRMKQPEREAGSFYSVSTAGMHEALPPRP